MRNVIQTVFALSISWMIASCAGPQNHRTSSNVEAIDQLDATVAAYARTRPTLAGPFPNGEYGTISDTTLTIALTEGLLTAQAIQHCDRKPTIKINYPRTDPTRTPANNYRLPECAQYRPRTSADHLFGPMFAEARCKSAIEKYESSLPQPTKTIEYTSDCYPTYPAREVFGNLRLHIVKEGSRPSDIAQASLIGTLNANTTEKRASLDISRISLQKDECLALTDAAGQPVPIRSTGERFFFATSGMQAKKIALTAEDNLRAAEALVSERKTRLQEAINTARADPNLKGNQCVKPPMRALPPKPVGMTVEQARQHAAAYCSITLDAVQRSNRVLNALIATGNMEYVRAVQRIGMNFSSCANRGYQYDTSSTAVSRIFDPFIPLEAQQQEIANQVHTCTSAVTRRCAPEHFAWESEVSRLRAEPDTLFNRCVRTVAVVGEESNKVRDAEATLTAKKNELANTRNQSINSSGSIPLSTSYCRSRG